MELKQVYGVCPNILKKSGVAGLPNICSTWKWGRKVVGLHRVACLTSPLFHFCISIALPFWEETGKEHTLNSFGWTEQNKIFWRIFVWDNSKLRYWERRKILIFCYGKTSRNWVFPNLDIQYGRILQNLALCVTLPYKELPWLHWSTPQPISTLLTESSSTVCNTVKYSAVERHNTWWGVWNKYGQKPPYMALSISYAGNRINRGATLLLLNSSSIVLVATQF